MARGKKSLDQKRRERRERLQGEHSHKTKAHECDNENNSGAEHSHKTTAHECKNENNSGAEHSHKTTAHECDNENNSTAEHSHMTTAHECDDENNSTAEHSHMTTAHECDNENNNTAEHSQKTTSHECDNENNSTAEHSHKTTAHEFDNENNSTAEHSHKTTAHEFDNENNSAADHSHKTTAHECDNENNSAAEHSHMTTAHECDNENNSTAEHSHMTTAHECDNENNSTAEHSQKTTSHECDNENNSTAEHSHKTTSHECDNENNSPAEHSHKTTAHEYDNENNCVTEQSHKTTAHECDNENNSAAEHSHKTKAHECDNVNNRAAEDSHETAAHECDNKNNSTAEHSHKTKAHDGDNEKNSAAVQTNAHECDGENNSPAEHSHKTTGHEGDNENNSAAEHSHKTRAHECDNEKNSAAEHSHKTTAHQCDNENNGTAEHSHNSKAHECDNENNGAAEHSHKTAANEGDNENDSAEYQTLIAETFETLILQHAREDACSISKEQLETIQSTDDTDLKGENRHISTCIRGVKRKWEESHDKYVNDDNRSSRNNSTTFSHDSTDLSELRERTCAHDHQSPHEVNDFDCFFKCWCDKEGLDIPIENITKSDTNVLKWSQNRECYSSFKTDVNQFVPNHHTCSLVEKTNCTVNSNHNLKIVRENSEKNGANWDTLHEVAGEKSNEYEENTVTIINSLQPECNYHEISYYNASSMEMKAGENKANSTILSGKIHFTTEIQHFDDFFLQFKCDSLVNENDDMVTIQLDKVFRTLQTPENSDINFETLEDLPGKNLKHKHNEEKNNGDSGGLFINANSEEVSIKNENVIIEMEHDRNDNTVNVPEEMDTELRYHDFDIYDTEKEQDSSDDNSEYSFTAEIWVNDQVDTGYKDQADVCVTKECVKENAEVSAQNGFEEIGLDERLQTCYKYTISNDLLNSNFSEEICTKVSNATVELSFENNDDRLIMHKNTCRGSNVHENRNETDSSNTEKQQSDTSESSAGYISGQVELNEMDHGCKKYVNNNGTNKGAENCGYEQASIKLKPSLTEEHATHSVFPSEICTSEGGICDTGSHSSQPNQIKFRRENSYKGSLDLSTTDGQRATIKMVDDTYIPDDVIMEAFTIMRKHSPHLAPYIGQLPPATQHLLRNSNETALLPYIPPDKISINIHHIDGHWLTSVFRPQNNTISVYDSLRSSNRTSSIRKDLSILYGGHPIIEYPRVTQQQRMPDCGAFAIAYAFSILLGIPPETQIYDVMSMRRHLKRVLQRGCLIPFPVSLESNCIADYFATQSKLLNKKQTTLESENKMQNDLCINRKSTTRREYMKTYMHKLRSEETTKGRQDRHLKDKAHKQMLRREETTKRRQDRLLKDKAHKQMLRSEETTKRRQDRHLKDKAHKQMLRSEETTKCRQERHLKDKAHKQMLRSEETTKHRQDRHLKDKAHKQMLRSEETTKSRQDRHLKDKAHKQMLRSEETTKHRQDRHLKDKAHKQMLRIGETKEQRQDRQKKNKLFMEMLRSKATAKQKHEYNEKSRKAMITTRSKESAKKTQLRHSKSKKYKDELICRETPAERVSHKMKERARVKKIRGNQKLVDRNRVNLKDKERKQLLQKLRLEQKTYEVECENFKRLSRAGPKYVCTVCRRLLYKQSVKNIYSQTFSKASPDLLNLCFTGKVSLYICSTCSRHLCSDRLPPMSVANKMLLQPIPECLHDLTELEERLVAQRIPFMKIMNLPKGKQKAIIGQVVNVPVDTAETVAALPRTANSSGFIPLKLKRKQSYTGHVLYQMIRPHKVEAALRYLVDHNEHYQNILLNEEWQKEFQNEDEELWDALVEPHKENTDNLNVTEENDETVTPSTTDKEENNVENVSELEVNDTDKGDVASNSHQEEESLRGLQYNTCIQPDDLANYLGNEVYSVAPGEGRLPLLIGNDANNEVLTFPTLFPDGKFGFDVQRMSKLTLRKYFQARLLSEDTRFAKNTEYLFYAQYLTEQKQISDSISIALRKAKLSVTEEDRVTAGTLKNTERLKQIILQDQGQRFMQNVRGSPAYCKKLLSDLLAMIRQLGSFTFFLTLSAADLRWPDTISVIASQYNVTLTEEDVKNMSWEERCHWIRRNPVTAARQFDYRVQLFVRHILGSGVIGEIDDFLYRVEFQRRGSPHIHMVIWIKDAPKYESESDQEIADFVDKHISCSLPDENDELREKVNEVQRHVHSNACKKKGKTCRFSFPRPPSCKTVICRGPSENAEKASAYQTENNSSDRQDGLHSAPQEHQHLHMTLNDQQQKTKKQGESKHPDRKEWEKNDSCNERRKQLEKHRNKTISSTQTKTSDIKKKSDTLNYQKNMPAESLSNRSRKHKEHISNNQLQGEPKEKIDKESDNAKYEANCSHRIIYRQNKIQEQSSVQENTKQAEDQLMEDQSGDQTESQKAAKQKAVLNMMFEAMFKLDISHETTVEDILVAAGLSQEEYEKALTNSKSSNGIILKRKPCERFINNYNPKILLTWGANMDIQYVSCPYACVMYISSYVTKPEHEMSELLEQTSKQAADCDIRQQLRKIGSKFLASREVSAQEAAYRVLSLPLSRSSREVIHVSTDPPSERLHLLKPMSVIKTLEDDDEDVYQIGLVERYMKRPSNLNHICLAEFSSFYRVDYKKTADERQGISCNVLNENKNNEKTIKLQDDLGFMRKRTKPAVIRTYKHSVKNHPEKYYHSMLMLYYPWRTEESFQEYGDGSFETMYHNVQQIITDNQSKFEKHTEIVDAAVQNLEDFGPPEDAWAEIAAESEHDREKQRVEGSRPAEEFAYIDPEVHPGASHAAAGGVNLLQKTQAWVMEDADYHRLIQSLNREQSQVYSELYKWFFDIITSRKTGKVPEPIRAFVSGCAGTGKSHLIKAIYQAAIKVLRPEAENPDDIVCLLTAPTSPAAYNINGQTLHSAFSLPLYPHDQSISQSRLSHLRNKLCSLLLLIIDEISMVGSDMLFTIHKRLSEIKGTTNKLFGGVSVLAFGDLSQLPPVGLFAVYKLPKSQMARLYGTVWNDFNGFELTEIMRQQEDQDFANLLKRVRLNEITDEDKKQLKSRVISKSDPDYPSDAIHVFATNALADKYNAEKLSQLRSPVYQIKSEDTRREINTSAMSMDIPDEDNKTGGLQETIQLAIGAKVMITKNVCTRDGLVNGMMGTVVGFHPPPSPTDTDFRPVFILVQLDDPKAGREARRKYKSVLKDWPDATPIVREEVKFKVGKYGVAEVARRQFPLRLSWACTIHKVQGLTLSKIVVSCEGYFRPGMFYVAVSRVKSLNCLYFTSLEFKKIIANSEATEALDTMLSTRPLSPMPIWVSDMHSLVISYLNVNSLVAHKDNLKCHQILNSSDIITVTETWLHPNYQGLMDIEGFTLVRADRAQCYSEGQLSKQTASYQRHGGVASFITNQCKMLESSHLVTDMEYLKIVVQVSDGSKISVITVYRPPSQNLTEFVYLLQKVLGTEVDDSVTTIVCGDFNVDGLGSLEQQPFQTFRQYGFLQIVQEPTHLQGACLDHVYVRSPEELNYRVVPVSFSPHAAIQLQYHSQ